MKLSYTRCLRRTANTQISLSGCIFWFGALYITVLIPEENVRKNKKENKNKRRNTGSEAADF